MAEPCKKTTLLILKHLITRQKLLRRPTPSCKNTATGSPHSQTSREFSDGEKCGLARIGSVSGPDFSRAAKDGKRIGLKEGVRESRKLSPAGTAECSPGRQSW